MIYAVRYAFCSLYSLFWGLLACAVSPFERSGESGVWMARQWARWILATCSISVEADGLEHLSPDQPVVLMSNHQSLFDIAAIIDTLPISFRFVAKKELTRIPLFGWGIAAAGHVIIDRGDNARAVASLRAAGERVRRGTNVIIFPEGTRSPTGALQPFKSGGFHLAIQAQVPIVPVTVSGTSRITPKGSLRIESGRVRVHYGRPIPTEKRGVEEREALKEQVREAILAGFDPELQQSAAP